MMDSTWRSDLVGGGRDGGGMTHKNQQVQRVYRIENPTLWRRYANTRSLVKPLTTYQAPEAIPARTEVATTRQAGPRVFADGLGLDTSRNEVLLFSGAPCGQAGARDVISIIKQQGFDERVGSISGMFGAAC